VYLNAFQQYIYSFIFIFTSIVRIVHFILIFLCINRRTHICINIDSLLLPPVKIFTWYLSPSDFCRYMLNIEEPWSFIICFRVNQGKQCFSWRDFKKGEKKIANGSESWQSYKTFFPSSPMFLKNKLECFFYRCNIFLPSLIFVSKTRP